MQEASLIIDDLEYLFAENHSLETILARFDEHHQMVTFTREFIETFDGHITDAIQTQMASVDKTEVKLQKVEAKRAGRLQENLVRLDGDLRAAAYVLSEDITHMVQQHAIEFNRQILDNRKSVLQFATQIRMGRADRQKEVLMELLRLRKEVWSPARTHYLLTQFQESMELLKSTKEKECLNAFQSRYAELHHSQVEMCHQLASVPPAELTKERIQEVSVAIDRMQKVDLQQHFDKLYRDLRAMDTKLHAIKTEKVEQLKSLLVDCNEGVIPPDAQAVIDSLYDEEQSFKLAAIQRQAVESITQQSLSNTESLLLFCDFAQQSYAIWTEHQKELAKLPDILNKNLTEIHAIHEADRLRHEVEMEHIVSNMRTKDENMSALQASMDKIQSELHQIHTVFEKQHQATDASIKAHKDLIVDQLRDCKMEMYTFMGISADGINDKSPLQSEENIHGASVGNSRPASSSVRPTSGMAARPSSSGSPPTRRRSAKGRRRAAQVVAHKNRLHEDQIDSVAYSSKLGVYHLIKTEPSFLHRQLFRWKQFMNEAKRRILFDTAEIEEHRAAVLEKKAKDKKKDDEELFASTIEITSIMEFQPPTARKVADMPIVVRPTDDDTLAEIPYLNLIRLDLNTLNDFQIDHQRTWINFLEDLEVGTIEDNDAKSVLLMADYQNELNEKLFHLEPRFAQYQKDVFNARIGR